MSATIRALGYTVTVADVDRWTPEHRAQACADPSTPGYDDWVVERLDAVMCEAGAAFIAGHPDLFATTDLT